MATAKGTTVAAEVEEAKEEEEKVEDLAAEAQAVDETVAAAM